MKSEELALEEYEKSCTSTTRKLSFKRLSRKRYKTARTNYVQNYGIQEWEVTVDEEKYTSDAKILGPNELDFLVQSAEIVINLLILLENI